MKKLLFLDNDRKELLEESLRMLDYILIDDYKLPEDYVNSIESISDFYHFCKEKSRDEIYNLLFDKNQVICTYSMYTSSHFNSLSQMLNIFSAVGRNRVSDLVYIDSSGYLIERLNYHVRNSEKNPIHIIEAVERNYILSKDYHNFSDKTAKRIRFNINDDYDMFKLVDLDVPVLTLFNNE